ncbi:MAG: 4-(cytidine 5'-diphospho)-2-C-methyl-D-erythritol kinase [candidate division WOR-3 bacterium]|nr:4-(cytidine 5'-diphospho)-2-C-methyl-D-erythritol kinase [candidate division WOR-3 bacterium]
MAYQSRKRRIKLLAPAKINIGLLIKRKLPTNYHEIETIMAPIRLFDTIIITKKKQSISFRTDAPKIPKGDKNLVIKAAKLFFEKSNIKTDVEIVLKKRIPIGAGLGGGSSDAACTLLGLNTIYGNPLSFNELKQLALNIGMDVPFFLYRRAGYVTGCGEIIKPIQLPKFQVLVCIPRFSINTKWAYAEYDRYLSSNFPIGENLTNINFSFKLLLTRLKKVKSAGINAYIVNSFESVIYDKYPDLLRIRNLLLASGAYGVSLSGSGSALMALISKNIKNKIRNCLQNTNCQLIFTETI